MLKVRIVTPLGQKFPEFEVPYITIPAWKGEMGIYPDHVPLLTSVYSGLVRFEKDGKEVVIAVHHGFIELDDRNVLTLCVRLVETADEIDKSRSMNSLERNQAALQKYLQEISVTEENKTKFEAKVARSLTRLSVK